MDNLTRKQIRYICFRLKSEAEDVSKADLPYLEEVKSHMEGQEDFGGWLNFGRTWDVDKKSYLVVVKRRESIESVWDKEVNKTAKDLPIKTKTNKKK